MACLAAASFLLAGTPVAAQQQTAHAAAEISAVETGLTSAVVLRGQPVPHHSIAAEMARLHVPGVSVAVLRGGKIVWAKGYGVTRQGGAPVTPETLFQAGSISKPVTALAALRLVEQHRLDLDRDVNEQLQGWKLPVPAGQHVTLRELLSHTAGTTVHGFPGYAAGTTVPGVDDVLAGRAPANTKPVVVDTPPGTTWRYSGGGYTVVQKLIGDVTGRPFEQVLQEEVLRPAGMTRSSFTQPLGSRELAGAALAHDGEGKAVAGGPHTYPELAAAGLWSTPSDLLRYAVAVQRSAQGLPNALLSRPMATTMLTPGKGDYGLGLEVHGPADNRGFEHGGSNEGYENTLVAYAGSGDGVAVMTNGARGNELASEITRSVAAAYGWPDHRRVERENVSITPAALARLPGEYAIPGLGTFSIAVAGSGLTVSLKEGSSEPLYAMSADTYFILSQDLTIRVVDDGRSITGRILTGPFDVTFAKMP